MGELRHWDEKKTGRFVYTPDEVFPLKTLNKPDPDEPYAYCPNWKEAHYGIARLGPKYSAIDPFNKFDPPPRWHIGAFIIPAFCSAVGVASVLQYNYSSRRPFFSQIYLHVFFGAVGLGLGIAIWKRSRYQAAVRDANVKRYIELHPELFPEIERVKYKNVIYPWKANRSV